MLPINHPAAATIDNRREDLAPAPRYMRALHQPRTRATGIRHYTVIPIYSDADIAPVRAQLRRLRVYTRITLIDADAVGRIPATARVLFADRSI